LRLSQIESLTSIAVFFVCGSMKQKKHKKLPGVDPEDKSMSLGGGAGGFSSSTSPS
jgi:hypothetical protein